MDTTTLLIILILVLIIFGGGWYGRGRWFQLSYADPTIKARIADLGSKTFPSSPAGFGELLANETEKWGKVIRAANIKPE